MKNNTLLDNYRAMWGLLQEAEQSIKKAQKQINSGHYRLARKTVKETLPDLSKAYRLSLYRRSKKLVGEFRTSNENLFTNCSGQPKVKITDEKARKAA